MPIKFGSSDAPFGGIIPKLADDKLPPGCAVEAINCNLSNGGLRALLVDPSDLKAMWGASGLVGDATDTDVQEIDKPATPTVTAGYPAPMCRPFESGHVWLAIKASYFIGAATENVGTGQVDYDYDEVVVSNSMSIVAGSLKYTDTGISFKATLPSARPLVPNGGLASIFGPIYQVSLSADSGGSYGGPSAALTLPENVYATSSIIPSGVAPLYWSLSGSDPKLYGYFQIRDADGPIWTEENINMISEFGDDVSVERLGGDVTFHIDLNYVDPTIKRINFCQTLVVEKDPDAAAGPENEIEGPPSELSDAVTIPPGHYIGLTLGAESGQANKLYRRIYQSVPGSDRYILIEEIDDASTWVDSGKFPLGTELSYFGNPPISEETGLDLAGFIARTVIDPAGFAVSFYNSDNGANKVCVSMPFAYHAWPSEFSERLGIPHDETIIRLAISNGQTYVFTTNRIYVLVGNDPSNLRLQFVSDDTPLLSIYGLCRIGGTVFYVSDNGLMMLDGSSTKNITANHYTREEWQARTPANMAVQTLDNCIYIFDSITEGTLSDTGIRVDLEEDAVKSIVEFDGLDDTTATLEWTSGIVRWPSPEALDFVRVHADGAVDVEVTVGVTSAYSDEAVADASGAVVNSSAFNRDWQLTLTADEGVTISSVELYERKVLDVTGDGISITPDMIADWQRIWLKFPNQGRFVAGVVKLRSALPVTLSIGGVDTTVSDDGFFLLPRDMAFAELVSVAVANATPLNQAIDSLTLFTRIPESVSQSVQEVHTPGLVPVWLRKRYEVGGPNRIIAGIVDATSYDSLSMRVWLDENTSATPDHTETISDGGVFVLNLDECQSFDFDFNGSDANVREVKLAIGRVPEDAGLYVREFGVKGTVPAWLLKEYRLAAPNRVASVRVAASSYPVTLRLFQDNGSSPVISQVINSGDHGKEIRLGILAECSSFRFDFNGNDSNVDSVILAMREVISIENDGFVVRGPRPMWRNIELEFPDTGTFVAGRVVCASYSTAPTIRLGANAEAWTVSVSLSSNNDFLFAALSPARRWVLDVEHTAAVSEVHLIGKVLQPVKSGRMGVKRGSGPLSFLAVDILSEIMWCPTCYRVTASAYPVTMTLSEGGVVAAVVTVQNENAMRLPRMPKAREWRLSLVGETEATIIHEAILATSMEGLR